MTPIIIPPPVWTESEGVRWTAPVGDVLFLEVVAIGNSFEWSVLRRESRTRYSVVTVDDDPLPTLAEAQSAAWAALSRRLGVAP